MEKLKLCALALAAFAALPDAEAASWTSGQAVGGGVNSIFTTLGQACSSMRVIRKQVGVHTLT